jgi:hypothetical protein
MRSLWKVILTFAIIGTLAIVGIVGYLYFPFRPADIAVAETVQPNADKPSLTVLGDSYSSGYLEYGKGEDGWPTILAEKHGFGLTLNAQPGTG